MEIINSKNLEIISKQHTLSLFPKNEKEINMFSQNAIFTSSYNPYSNSKEFFVYEELNYAEIKL
jgi:hypothetical protein